MVWCREAVVEQEVPHSGVMGKNQEEYLESEQSQPQARPHNPGFQHQKDKSPHLAVKTSGAGESGDGKMETTVPEQQFKKKKSTRKNWKMQYNVSK